MVTERRDWSERSAAWLRDAAQAGMPLFGICYGHQLLAHALGGEVGDNPAGREMGTIGLELHPHAEHDPLFAGLPAQFAAQATHLQTVLRAPEGATVLARSSQDDCHAFRWGDRAWGVQFHPEFSATHMRGYVQARQRRAGSAKAAAPRRWPATSARRRRRGACCGASSGMRADLHASTVPTRSLSAGQIRRRRSIGECR